MVSKLGAQWCLRTESSAYDEWLTIEEFPPYELALGEGRHLEYPVRQQQNLPGLL